jgi:hypothetical protein
MPDKPSKPIQQPDRRRTARSIRLSNPMMEIRFAGCPRYQLKVRDLSNEGAGIIVRPDSDFLKMIEVGQELNVSFVLPRDYIGPSGNFRSKVVHIDEILKGPFKGHRVVGLSFLAGANSA